MPSINFTDKEVEVLAVMIGRMDKIEWEPVASQANCTNAKQAKNVWWATRKKIANNGGSLIETPSMVGKVKATSTKKRKNDSDETPSKKQKKKTANSTTPVASEDDEEDKKKHQPRARSTPSPPQTMICARPILLLQTPAPTEKFTLADIGLSSQVVD